MRVKNDHRSKFFFLKFTAMIILHSHLQPQFKNESFHILDIISLLMGDMNSINCPEPWPVFFVYQKMKPSSFITFMGSYPSENNCNGRWRREITGHMYDIKGLADLAAGSPLFSESIFLFWWAAFFGLHELCYVWRESSSLHRLSQIFSIRIVSAAQS